MEVSSRKVRISRRVYPSIAAAARALKLPHYTVRNRLQSPAAEWRSWRYVHPGEGRTIIRQGNVVVVYLGNRYKTLRDAAKAHGRHITTVRKHLLRADLRNCYYQMPDGKRYKG